MSELSPVKRALRRIEELERELAAPRRFEPIAIVAMACRLPGGVASPDDFWKLLSQGKDAVCEVPAGRWPLDAYYSENPDAPGKHVNRHGGFLSGAINEFDARLFGIPASEANALDPQQRLLLETSWEAWENAGIPIDTLRGSQTGVWIGISASDYTQAHLRSGDPSRIGPYDVTGSIGSTAAGRISYFFDLRGPSMAVDTACSSSLVAIDLACAALRERACGMALAGGVSLILSPEANVCFSKMQALSPDGRSKAFDAAADGFGRGEGCGLLVLERLQDAERAGHPVLAVIRSSAVNQDGRSNGLTAPSVSAQKELLRTALERGGLRAGDIGYLEAHGTGTPLGDPIEIEAVADVLGADRAEPLWVGSVKTNIGHLEAAAGVAGVIKTVLMLQNRQIPAHLHFREPSPHIPWHELPLRVPVTLTDWTGSPRRAGVSSFGFGGTNGHLILEEAAAIGKDEPISHSGPSLLCLSAREDAALENVVRTAVDFCVASPVPFEEICRAFRTQRLHQAERVAFVADTAEGLARARRIRGAAKSRPRFVFAFTGQGSQYAGMGRELYLAEAVFREAFDRCAAVFDPSLPASLASFCFEGIHAGGLSVDETQVTQPALFAIGFALSELLGSWGVRPEAVFGHSIGEYVAATVAGVFSLDDACRLVAARSALMQALPRTGGMASIFLDADSVAEALLPWGSRLEIAALNAPSNVTVSGESTALDRLLESLSARGVRYKRLAVSHAFHSPLMDPILGEFRRQVAACERRVPQIPLYSNLTGTTGADFTATDYWAQHLRRAVRFEDCARNAAERNSILIELGSAPILSALGKEIDPAAAWIPTLRRDHSDRRQVLETLGNLYVYGATIDWDKLGRPASLVRLPNYSFERQRYWMDAPARAKQQGIEMQQRETSGPTVRRQVLDVLATILRDNAGIENVDPKASLLDLGVDSLMLMTTRQQIIDRYGVEIPVSQFFEDLSSLEKLAAHVERVADPARLGIVRKAVIAPPAVQTQAPSGPVQDLFAQQLHAMSQLMANQLETLRGMGVAPAAQGIPLPPSSGSPSENSSVMPELFVPYKPIRAEDEPGIDDRRKRHMEELSQRFIEATAPSKEAVERYRPVFANNRHIAGFRPAWKEMVYQLSAEGAEGSRIRAAGGREFIDMTMGFGVHLFGHKPAFIQDALRRQLEKGAPLGPVSDLAGPAAEKFCRMTGMERVAFYNTGSEAVMTALRIARTATQRNRIAIFEGSYHGTFDGVLALRREKDGQLFTAPGSPGTTPGMTEDVMVLRYDDPQSLDLIGRYGSELAAVLVEPVQSRRPDVRPRKFLEDVRALTKGSGTVLIFDEMVTGFRCHPGGAQAYFDIRADIATYGKVIGGGMPIGLVAGSADYMDAVDGGAWRFGDDSYPAKRNTFVAGTFCHHPLSLAAMLAVLDELERQGPALQENLNRRTTAFCDRLNAWLTQNEVPIRVAHFGSLLRFFLRGDLELLFYHLIARGIYVWEGRNCFISTAHSDEDLDRVAQAVFESVEDLRRGGYLPSRSSVVSVQAAGENASSKNGAVRGGSQAKTPTLHFHPVLCAPLIAPNYVTKAAMEFSLFYFSSSSQVEGESYRLLLEGAKYADRNGYTAVWTPERHFHDFGGLYPNPAITCAALASVTSRIRLRAGSVVILLHDPVRFAENWAMVDQLSGGRIDLALALGWNSNDFIFAPDRYQERSRLLPEQLATVRGLWNGGAVERTGGKGEKVQVHAYPRPVQAAIPIWFTAAGNPDTFRLAGQHGANVLTYLEGQTLEELAAKIQLYRKTRREHGHAGPGHVTLMLHTFLGSDLNDVLRRVDKPLREYLRSSLFLRTQFANSVGVHIDKLSEEDLKPILDRAVDRYIRTCSLIGTPESCREMIAKASAAGVDEIGCLIDFGVPFDDAMQGLESLTLLKNAVALPEERSLSLTHEQRQLWYLTQQGKEASVAYNEMALLRLSGPLIASRLEEAFQRVAARHQALRTVRIGEAGQVFAENIAVRIDQAPRTLEEEAARPFDFDHGPMFRVALKKTGPDEHLLLFTAHHIAANGWTISLALEEAAAIYTTLTNGQKPNLPDAVPFERYLEWEKGQEERSAADAAYWARQLSSPLPTLELPTSKPRCPLTVWRGERRSAGLEGELLRGLRAAARQNGCTLFMVLMGAWQTLLWRLTGASRIAVWTPVARQGTMGVQALAGQCTRMFPVIGEFGEGIGRAAMLAQIRRAVLDVYEHQGISLAQASELRLPPAITMFNLDRTPALPKFESVKAALETAPIASAKYELSLNALEIGGRLILDFEYRAELFDAETIQAWIASYLSILQLMADASDAPLASMNLHSTPPPLVEPVVGEGVLAAFERQAALDPGRIALRERDRISTFGQLHDESNRLATALAAHGVQRGDGVGLEPGHPFEAVAVRLALMKLGAVSMEPAHGSILSMLGVCDHAALILSRGSAARMMPHDHVLDLDELDRDPSRREPLAAAGPEDPQQVGCVFHLDEESYACTNATLARQAYAARALLQMRAGDVIAVCGRAGVETILGALTTGATIDFQSEPDLARADIAVVPAHFAKQISPGAGGTRTIAFTDGPLDRASARRFEDATRIVELCRPRGIPVMAASGAAGKAGYDRRGVLCDSIYLPGRAIAGVDGVTTRWQMEGARGSCLTETRVQVSRNGLLWMSTPAGEVEAALREFARDSVVFTLAGEDGGDPSAVAWVVPADGTTVDDARTAVASVVPAELVPDSFVELSSIPEEMRGNPWALTALGGPARRSRDYIAPRDEFERGMCALWEEVLERTPVGIHDRFSELGGQSLHAMRLAVRVRQKFGITLTLADLLGSPTPALLCRVCRYKEHDSREVAEIPVLAPQADYALSRAQHRMWAMAQMRPQTTGYNVPAALLLEGPLQVETLRLAFADLAARHEALRTRFVEVRGEPRQKIVEGDPDFELIQETAGNEATRSATAAMELAATPFDLATGPLWRALLLQFGPDRHGLAMAFHHIITDGWSLEVCARDLGALYEARLGRRSNPQALSLQYRHYAAWDSARSKGDVEGLSWWREKLAGFTRIELPSDFVPANDDTRVATLRVPFGGELTGALDSLCRSLDVTRFVALASATAAFLHRLSGKAECDADITLGTPVARREHPLLMDQVGLFVNTVVLRERFAPGDTFKGLVGSMRRTCLDAVSHGDTPFDMVVEHLHPGTGWQRPPLFDVMVAFEEQPRVARFWGDARLRPVDVPPVENLFDLNFRFQASAEGEEITLALDYRVGRFENSRIELWCARLMNLLWQALRDPEGPVSRIDLRTDAEKTVRRRNRVEIRL